MDVIRTRLGIWSSLHSSWVDFMTHTSMHGVKYICEDGRKWVERIFWTIVIIIQIVITVFMVMGLYKRYSTRPTMANIERTHYPSWHLPFPGVTICNTNRILKSKAETVVNQLVLPEGTNRAVVLERFKFLGELSDPDFPANSSFDELQRILHSNRYTISSLMLEVGQSCEELFDKCTWQGEIVECSELFEIRKSHYGYCCSFNHLGVQDAERGYHSERLWRVEGRRKHTNLHGMKMGLSLLINPMVHEYFQSSYHSNGIGVIIHDTQEYPDESMAEKLIPVGKEAMLPISLSALYCTPGVRDLHPAVRRCVFGEEHRLSFFPEYTDRACVVECKMNYTLRLCGCLPYYYPNNGLYRTCDLTKVQCLYENSEILHTRHPIWYGKSLIPDDEIQNDTDDAMICDCPKQCDHVNYFVEVTVGDFQASQLTVNPFFTPDMNVTDRVLLHIFLESNFSQLTKRDIMNSLSDLLSNLGGVVCLFLGCSFVTLVEVAYFFTIRLRIYKVEGPLKEEPECPFTPREVRDARYPSVRRQNRLRVIRVLPKRVISADDFEFSPRIWSYSGSATN